MINPALQQRGAGHQALSHPRNGSIRGCAQKRLGLAVIVQEPFPAQIGLGLRYSGHYRYRTVDLSIKLCVSIVC